MMDYIVSLTITTSHLSSEPLLVQMVIDHEVQVHGGSCNEAALTILDTLNPRTLL